MKRMHREVGEGDLFRHEAFLYSGHDQFVAGTTTFLLDALEAGQTAFVMVARDKIGALRAALNGDADRVFFSDVEVIGENPARIIPAWQGFVTHHGGNTRGLRGIGEPFWAGRSRSELDECHVHESLLDTAFGDVARGGQQVAGAPFWLLCPYDTTGLDAADLAEACRTHPLLYDGDTHRPSDGYGLRSAVDGPHDGPALGPVPDNAERLAIGGATALPSVRAFTERVLAGFALGRERLADFVLAVDELATNSVLHGGGAGTLSLWSDDHHAFAEVRDTGRISDPLVGRVQPTPTARSGRGLWIANQLCELVQIRSTRAGTVVRIHLKRH